ncbi:MAG: hypothetical protein M9894_29650 [Planctomycetes bacterium]|nr:hypothetical protein [Planctomycetota bacterium]
MPDVQDLLRHAVPRLKKDDDAARKLERRLVRMARAAVTAGAERLEGLGVRLKRRPTGDDLEALRDALGDKGFVTLFRGLKDELAATLKKGDTPAKRRPSSASGRAASASGRTAKKKRTSSSSGRARRAGSGSGRMTISSHDDTGSGSGELAVPDELALPPDEPSLTVPDELTLGDAPLSIRFDAEPAAGAPPAGAAARDEDDADPARAADRAVARYRAAGDPDELDQAKKLYTRAAKAAEHDLARGAARAGLAQVALLLGDADRAAEHAEKALALFPDEPVAARVLLRARRPGEGERERLAGALARARAALRRSDRAAALAAGEELEALAPREPFGPMVALAVQHEQGERQGLEAAIARVWERYPASVGLADLPLGEELERPVVLAPLLWVRQRIEQDGGAALTQTVKDVDSKQNVIAGAVQVALGVARAALATRAQLGPLEEQELRKWVGQALLAAQYYDHAKDVLAQARTLDRNSGHVLEINRDEQSCGVMKRAFDKPGVKARSGKLDGVGLVQLRKAIAARLQAVLAQKDEALGTYEQDEERIIAAVTAAPERRKKVEARAKKAGQPSPFDRLDAIEQELSGLDEPRAAAPEPEAPAGGGLLGRWKGGLSKALDKAKSAAKGAELALRKGVAASKQKEAARALAVRLRDRPDGGWGDAELDRLIDRWQEVSSRAEALEEEAEELRRAAGKAGQV